MQQREQIDEIWAEYAKSATLEVKNKLVELYLPFVQKIAAKLAKKINYHVSPEELASYGLDGLYSAIDKYELGRGVKFESFAQQRVNGSMIDWLRKEDIVPRSVRMNFNEFDQQREKMQNDRGRKVGDDEVAEAMGLDEEFLTNKKKFYPVAFYSLEGSVPPDSEEDQQRNINANLEDREAVSPDGHLGRIEFFTKLMGTHFSKLEKMIVYLYFYKNYTMDRVATQVELSESRVSQMLKKILPRLRKKIERNPEFFSEDLASYINHMKRSDAPF